MKVLSILVILSACALDWANSCNSYYDGHGLFGDNYMNGRPHVHVHQGHGHYNQHGHGYDEIGGLGLMDSLFRTDIGGMGSHGHHHHHHRHSPVIPMSHSHHRHVHRVYRRSPYVRLNLNSHLPNRHKKTTATTHA